MTPIENFIFLYHTMIASERLLELAAEEAAGDLRNYYLAHLEEERGHAQWLAEDLTAVGIEVKRTQVPIEAIEMVGSVYYFILHVDPVALLGYMRVLEGTPVASQELEKLETQYPKKLLRTLRHHAEHDGEHARELEKVIAGLTAPQRSLVEQTERQTRAYLAQASRKTYAHG